MTNHKLLNKVECLKESSEPLTEKHLRAKNAFSPEDQEKLQRQMQVTVTLASLAVNMHWVQVSGSESNTMGPGRPLRGRRQLVNGLFAPTSIQITLMHEQQKL